MEAPGHRPNKGPRAQIGRIKKNRGRPLADARQGQPSTPRPGEYAKTVDIYKPGASGRDSFLFFSQKNTHPEKSVILGCFFERNPLPGSAPARHLEPDALILARFGAVRGQISHKTHFSENYGATF